MLTFARRLVLRDRSRHCKFSLRTPNVSSLSLSFSSSTFTGRAALRIMAVLFTRPPAGLFRPARPSPRLRRRRALAPSLALLPRAPRPPQSDSMANAVRSFCGLREMRAPYSNGAGGTGYTGPTVCSSGTCKVSSQYYSECRRSFRRFYGALSRLCSRPVPSVRWDYDVTCVTSLVRLAESLMTCAVLVRTMPLCLCTTEELPEHDYSQ
jgi:hypothetical protein